MRSIFSLLTVAIGLIAFLHTTPAKAQGVGVGLIVGEPTGLTLKFPLSSNTAFDLAIGAVTFDNEGDDVQAHFDWLFSPGTIARGRNVTVPFYFGIGGVLEFADNGNNDDLDAGIRIPVGLALEFQQTPLELFFEAGLELLVIDNDGDEIDFAGALGLRFYF